MALWDGGGNVPPHRALARELRRAGHEVHVLTRTSCRLIASHVDRFGDLPRAAALVEECAYAGKTMRADGVPGWQ
jgi:hypothetical protein